MQIHRVGGHDLRDALERARRTHGANAVVLAHEPMPGGGVTVSVTDGGPELEPGARDVAQRLAEAGASHDLTRDVLSALRESGVNGTFAIDTAASVLADAFRAAPSPRHGEGACVLALVGPTGSGKTTTVAKLARRMFRAGRRIRVATLDSNRHGGAEFLASECKRDGIHFAPVRYREDLTAMLADAGDADAFLLDTTGRSPKDREHLDQLADVLGDGLSGADVTAYLTVSAAASPESLDEVLRGFSTVKPRAVIVTKLDETRRTAAALEFAGRADLPVAFLCSGQDVNADLHRASPDRMADLVLGGRVR